MDPPSAPSRMAATKRKLKHERESANALFGETIQSQGLRERRRIMVMQAYGRSPKNKLLVGVWSFW